MITKPTIHINGNKPEPLLEELREAMDKLRAAQDALSKCDYANARNHYPQGNAAVATAQLEHENRRRKLHEVHQELEEIAIHVSNSIK